MKRRSNPNQAASPTKKQRDDTDRFSKIENRHYTKQIEKSWSKHARTTTALPIQSKDGSVQFNMQEDTAISVDDAPASFGLPKKEDKDSKLGYKECMEWLSLAQRELLTKQDNELNPLGFIDFLVRADQMGQEIIQDPTTNLYKLESIFTRMNRYKLHYQKCANLAELEDICKQYLSLFVTIGKIFIHILPSYIVVVGEGATGGKKKLSRYYELLCVHLYQKWLFDNIRDLISCDKYILSKPHLIEHVCEVVGSILHVAKSFNFRDEYLSCYLTLLAKTDSNKLFTELSAALEQDSTLSLAASLVPKILNRAYLMKRKADPNKRKVKFDAQHEQEKQECHTHLIGRTMRLCDYIHINKKEKNALTELQRKGINEKQVLAKRKTETEKNANKEIAYGLVSGDFQKFTANKKVILESMMTLFIRILKDPASYSVECVYETLRSLSKHAEYINLEMAHELFNELKSLASSLFNSKKYSQHGAALALAAVMAALELMKISSKSSETYIESDVQWLIPTVIEAINVLFPTVCHHRLTDRHAIDCIDLLSANIKAREQLSLDELIEVLNQVVDSRRALGSLGESFSHLAKCPKVTELYVALTALASAITSPSKKRALTEITTKLSKRYPTLVNTHDDEGLVVDSLSNPYTVVWCNHLNKINVFSG